MTRDAFLSIGFAERRLVWEMGAAPAESSQTPPPVEVSQQAPSDSPERSDEAVADAAEEEANELLRNAEEESIRGQLNTEMGVQGSLQLMMDELQQQGKKYEEAFDEVKNICPDPLKDRLRYRHDTGKLSFNAPRMVAEPSIRKNESVEQPVSGTSAEAQKPAPETGNEEAKPTAEKPEEILTARKEQVLSKIDPEASGAIRQGLDGLDPKVQNAMLTLLETAASDSEKALQYGLLGMELNKISPSQQRDVLKIAADPKAMERAKKDPRMSGLVSFVERLDPAQNEALQAIAMQPEAGVIQPPVVPAEQLDQINDTLGKFDLANMTEVQKNMRIGQVMMTHGVNVVESGGKLVAIAPIDGMEAGINKIIGFVTFLTSFADLFKKKEEKPQDTAAEGKEGAQVETPDVAAARERVSGEIKGGKSAVDIRTDREAKKTAAENELNGPPADLKKNLLTAKTELGSAEAEVKTLQEEIQKMPADDPARAAMETRMSGAKTKVANAQQQVEQAQTKVTAAEKKVADAASDLDALTKLDEAATQGVEGIKRGLDAQKLVLSNAVGGKVDHPMKPLLDAMQTMTVTKNPDTLQVELAGPDIGSFRMELAKATGTLVTSPDLAISDAGVVENPDKFNAVLKHATDKAQTESAPQAPAVPPNTGGPKVDPGEKPGDSNITAEQQRSEEGVVEEHRSSVPEFDEQTRSSAFYETWQRIQAVLNREQSNINANEMGHIESGVFGTFHRIVTQSNPYDMEISNSRKRMETVRYANDMLDAAKMEPDVTKQVEQLNAVRRILGMREVNADFTPSEENPTGEKAIRGVEHFKQDQELMDVSRDVAMEGVMALGSLGGGAVAGVARKGAQVVAQQGLKYAVKQAATEGAKEGAAMAGALSASQNADEYMSGDKTAGEAIADVTVDTAKGAAVGAAIGGVLPIAGRGFGKTWRASGDLYQGAKTKVSGTKDKTVKWVKDVWESRKTQSSARQNTEKTFDSASKAKGKAAERTRKTTRRERPNARAGDEQPRSNPRSKEQPKGQTANADTFKPRQAVVPLRPGETPEAFLQRMTNELMDNNAKQHAMRSRRNGSGFRHEISSEIQELEDRAVQIRASMAEANTLLYQKLNPKDSAQAILGLKDGYSKRDISLAYQKMAQKYHPDLYPDDFLQARIDFKIINNAYSELLKK